MYLLDASSSRCTFACCLCSQLLARRLATCGLTGSLLGAGHDDDAAVAVGEMQESDKLVQVVISASTLSFLNDMTGPLEQGRFRTNLTDPPMSCPYKHVAFK